MSEHTSANKRVAKNTLMLYIRMLLIMAVSLYTSRVVLDKLGIEDFGIYSVVAGVVVSFSILTNTLSGAISRFITFELGKKDLASIKSVVATSINIQLCLSFIVIILCETIGVWFLNSFLNIPVERMFAANWVFQAAMASFVLRLMIVPFEAMIVAHEDMQVYAYMGIVDVCLQLGIVYLLGAFSFDKLILYGWLLVVVVLVTLSVYLFYCKRHYVECHYTPCIDKAKFREMAGFAGWNFLGTSAGILRKQGVDIVVNIFAGVAVNAARGVATQLDAALCRFTTNFTAALKPQIIKSYASNDYKRMFFLVNQGARFSFYLMLFLSIPIVLEMDIILGTWLKNVPEWAVMFTRLQVIESVIAVLSTTLIIAMLATGKIRRYQIVVSCATLCNFPLCILILYLGCPVYFTYVVAIFIEFVSLYLRLVMARQLLGMNLELFFKNVIANVFGVGLAAMVLPIVIHCIMDYGYMRLFVVLVISVLCCGLSILLVGLKASEQQYIKNIIYQKIKILKK